jgi:hypothetical protein
MTRARADLEPGPRTFARGEGLQGADADPAVGDREAQARLETAGQQRRSLGGVGFGVTGQQVVDAAGDILDGAARQTHVGAEGRDRRPQR